MLRRLVFVGIVLCVCAPLVMADAPRTGLVTGTVVDVNAAALPGVTVQLKGERGDMTAISDADGAFKFFFVIPDTYTVRVDLEGFQPAEGIIIVSAGGRAELTLQMQEAIGEEIVVTAESPMISKFDVSAGGTLGKDELNVIAAESRYMQASLNFLPGVVNNAYSQAFYMFEPQLQGHEGTRNANYIDGVDTSFSRLSGSTRLFVPSYAFGEVKVKSTGADAQYSRVSGGYITTTLKSGTNRLRGGASYYMRNLDWDKNYDLITVEQPDEIKAALELSLGGPIVKDKLWFFLGYGDREDPGVGQLASGTNIDVGMVYESTLAKLDWRPSTSHSVSATYIESPNQVVSPCPTCADQYTVVRAAFGAEMIGLGWNWAINDSLFLDAHVAVQDTIADRAPYAPEGDQQPGYDIWQPWGNDFAYRDLLTNFYWSGVERVLGIGPVSFPRDQMNASLEWFAGNHDVKGGIDYQEVAWESAAIVVDRVRGRGYNPEAPGGFDMPSDYREFYKLEDGQVARNQSESIALYVRDRITANRWTLNLGLRVDQQKHTTDVGVVTVDATDVAPRASVVYDVKGDGRMLLSATAGRYVTAIPQNWSALYNEMPSGTRFYDMYNWNPATEAYDIFVRSVLPGSVAVTEVDAWGKDEFALGFDWSFHPVWALKTKLVYWKTDDITQAYEQVDAGGNIILVQENNPWAEMEHMGLNLSVRRRFRNNWSFAGSYAYAETTGTCNLPRNGTQCQGGLGAYIDAVDPVSGVPWTLLNRDGNLDTDRTHVFKLRGVYRLQLGHGHSVSISGQFFNMSGEVYARYHMYKPVPGASNVRVYDEPVGSNRLDDQKQLNASLEWNFPIAGSFAGYLRWQVNNVTNEQNITGKLGSLERNGKHTLDYRNLQRPLTQTVFVGFTF